MVIGTGAALLASSLVGAGMSGLQMAAQKGGTKLQFERNKALQAQAAKLNYDYSIKSAKNQSLAMREGLEKAGYNPMLAVQNSTSGANSSWTSAQSVSAPDYGSAISSGIANVSDYMRLRNETSSTESINDKNYAEADEAKARKMEVLSRLPFVSQRQKAELSKMTAETAEIENRIHLANEALKLQQTGMDINVKSYQLEKEVQDIMRDKEDRYKQWGSKHPYLRNIDETVSRYLGKSPISFSKRVK